MNAPKDISFEPVDASTIELTWMAPKNGGSAVNNNDALTSYEVIYSANASLPLNSWNKVEVNALKFTSIKVRILKFS